MYKSTMVNNWLNNKAVAIPRSAEFNINFIFRYV